MAFDYATELFSGAEAGDVWLADSGDHFQDSARTTAAGNGDPVGSATGQGGNHNAQQTGVDTLKPTLTQDVTTGKWYFSFDGGDTLIAGTTADWNYLHHSTGNNAYLCAAVRFGATAEPDAAYAVCGTGGVSSSVRGFDAFFDDRSSVSNDRRVRIFGSTGGGAAFDIGTAQGAQPGAKDCLVEFIRQGSSTQLWLNRVLVGFVTQSNTSGSNAANALAIGAVGSGTFNLIGRIYGLLVTNTVPSAANLADIRIDMSARMAQPLFWPAVGSNTAAVTLIGFPAAASGIAVDVSVDRDGPPFYSATGQSANGSGELAITATGCPLATGTRTVWIRCTNSDGNAGGVSNNSRAFYAPVSVTVS